ncbi:MAG: TlpA family protein disulfide reductase [Actinobacteria bacterium]|nr:TlpA family protein disulfide reductase [Actinomycetota bacterium]
MTDDPIRDALRVEDRPIAPDPRFRDLLWERLREEVDRRPVPVRPSLPPRGIRAPARRALASAAILAASFAVLAVFLWPLRGWLSDRPPASNFAPSPLSFRATIVGSFPVTAQGGDRGGDFELLVSYRGPDAWRIDVTGGDAAWQPLINANVDGIGSYVLWDGQRLVAFDGSTGTFVRQRDHAAWFSPLNLLGFRNARSGWEEACTSGSRLGSETIADRSVDVLRCPAPASFSSSDVEVRLWVDIDSGLILKLVSSVDPGQLFPPGPVAWYSGERIEVRSIEYGPGFDEGTFVVPEDAPPSAPDVRHPPGNVTSIEIGQVAPSFSGETLDGVPFELSATRGTPTLVYVWGEWCRPCVEFPLDVLDREFVSGQGVNVVTVALADPPTLEAFVRKHGYRFPVVFPDDPSLKVWDLRVVPTLILLDADGRLVGAYSGWSSELADVADVEAVLEAFRSGAPLPEIPGSTSKPTEAS